MNVPDPLTTVGFDALQRETLEKEIQVWPARAFYPSSLGHPCDRMLVWRFTRHEEQARHDATLQAIFDHGRAHQPLIEARLRQMGFQLQGESDRPTQWRPAGPKGPVISGRIDGRLLGFRGEKFNPTPILEAKSMSGYEWDAIQTVDDLRSSSRPWTRSYFAQGNLYCLLESVPVGVFVIMSKATGLLKLLPYELDYGYAEAIVQRVERLQPFVTERRDPEPIAWDRNICGDCGFRARCYPARSFGDGATVLDDAELIDALTRREELKPYSSEYDKVDRAIKDRLKHEGVKFALVGPFVIEGKVLTKHIKAQEATTREEVRYDIRRQATSYGHE